MEELIINIIHLVTFCWSISRIWAGYNAWKPFYLDMVIGAVALFSYIIVVSITVTESQWTELAASPLEALLAFMVMASLYVGLTAAFAKFRRLMYKWLNDDATDQRRVGLGL